MIVDNTEHEKGRVQTRRNSFQHIIDWGEDNDYPQSVIDIVNSSITGSACLDIYHKFIFGRGFADSENYQLIVNKEGETADAILEQVSKDYATFGGFALHFNMNMLGQIVSIHYIPYENCRLCNDAEKKYDGMVAIHPDWGGRSHKKFNETPIEYIDLYTPNLNDFLNRVANAGGIAEYKGQVLYYSNEKGEYPLPTYEAALTDMSTQEAISNITYRNARRAFLPAGCFAEVNELYDEQSDEDKENFDKVGEVLRGLQGDKNAAAIMHVVVKDEKQLPRFISMKGVNYDKEYTVSRDSVKQNIGQAFRQPEELRCEKTASGFSNDTMIQAYKVYNSITSKERQVLEAQFTAIFKQWRMPLEYNFQILPLSYGAETIQSRLGNDSAKDVVELAKDTTLNVLQRKALLMSVYGLEEDEANNILLLNADNN